MTESATNRIHFQTTSSLILAATGYLGRLVERHEDGSFTMEIFDGMLDDAVFFCECNNIQYETV